MSARVQATTKPNFTLESINTLLDHVRMLSEAVTQIQNEQGSMDQTQVDTLITSIKGTAPVPKAPHVYSRNPVQVESKSIINYGIAVGAKRFIYAT